MNNKTLHIGQVSINLLDDYESRLFEHAIKDEHGSFCQYIKRLIERDRESVRTVNLSVPSSSQIDDSEENERAEGSFFIKESCKATYCNSDWFSLFFLLNKT